MKYSLWLFILVTFHGQTHVIPKQSEIYVKSINQLAIAVSKANKTGHVKIILAPGIYEQSKTISITAPYITLTSSDMRPERTIIKGSGMQKTKGVDNLIRVSGHHFTLDGISLRNSGNHLIQIAGEQNADYPVLRNCVLQDAYEQMVKVSYNRNTGIASDFGLIENCHFEYTQGIGPQYYIGGVDVHGGQDWVVKNNTFIGIASPEKKIAEHAIHFWNNTQNIRVENNTIVNCDRGIGFGMPNRPNFGGLIHNNLILHANNSHPRADTGIVLEESQGTIVTNNRILLLHNYANAIEYRFKQTKNVLIKNNIVNKRIRSRNGGKAKLESNTMVHRLDELLSKVELDKWQDYIQE